MRVITRKELTALIHDGAGVVLVDHQARTNEKASTLHAVTCRWVAMARGQTPLRFDADDRAAVRWLRRERGEEGDHWQKCPGCGGQASAVVEPRPDREVGTTVWTSDRGRDLGFVVSAESNDIRVAAFDSPARPQVRARSLPLARTSTFRPAVGDRCFVDILGSWRPATCAAEPPDADEGVEVILEGSDERLEVPIDRVRFRRIGPLLGPLGELAERRVGDLDRHRVRAQFVDAYARMAAPARGLQGALSAAVDLHAHQVGVARRVLADPVQRYLLADEVGLGKTIEAGLVIRQRLIDAPRSHIVVLVPGALRWQWRSELESKLGLSEVRKNGVEVASYEDERTFRRRIAPDLVVIDEAHRIAAGWSSESSVAAERFEAARALAHRVPRLLLLSATPVLHRERDLLAMLHLLDPDTYRLEDLDAFTKRVRDRALIGELLLSLRPGAPSFLVSARLPDLRSAFSGDARMKYLIDRIEKTISDESDERETALAEARAHVSETYRLHRRLLRNRRESVDSGSFRVRGRGGFQTADDGDPRRAAVDDWLESWRAALVTDVHELGPDGSEAGAMRLFRVFASVATGDLEVLRDLAAYRRTLKRSYREEVGLTDDDAVAIRRGFPRTDAQREMLERLEDVLGDPDVERPRRARRLARLLLRTASQGPNVVFASAPATVAALSEELETTGVTWWSFTAGLSDDERQSTVEGFTASRGDRLLLCDSAGEEGLNLQAADRVIHLDLPLSTTRLEQRIGRLDRRGEGSPVSSLVLQPGPAGGIGAFWLRALDEAFRVFDRTTGPVQYAIETVERELLQRLFADGVDYAEGLLEGTAQRVAEEQERIDRLDSLDALAHQDADDVAFVDDLLRAENVDAEPFAEAVAASIRAQRSDLGALVAKRRGGGHIVSFDRAPPPLRLYPGIKERPVEATHDRGAAVLEPSLGLLRPGSPLVEALRQQQEWDDRSQAAAVWKEHADFDDFVVGVRCEFVIRADPSEAYATWADLESQRPREATAMRTDADAPLVLSALQRRLDAYLPPNPHTLWFGTDGHELVDPDVLSELQLAIDDADPAAAWDDRRWAALESELGLISVADLLLHIAEKAPAAVLAASGSEELARAAVERASSEWADVERLLVLRADLSLEASSAARDLEAERRMARHLAAAIQQPTAVWSGACLVVLAPRGRN